MCGRFTVKATWAELVALYRLTMDAPPHNLRPRYNVCPTDPVDAVTAEDGKRELISMRWGLVPWWWSKSRRQGHGMEEQGVAALSAPHAGCRCFDRVGLLGRHQYAPCPPCAQGAICGRDRQGCRQPGLAEGEERLGGLEHPTARRGADRADDPRRHRRSRPARSKSHVNLAAYRHRRACGRPEGVARDQEHGRRKHGSLALGPRRPNQA